ncbi:hypothetical protein GWI34_40395 [Actinomadura sp. DSM 109109]|nr:hypothetical protein [Actinomadura lepetitiana]
MGAAFAIVATASTVSAGTVQTQVVHGNLHLGNAAPSGSLLMQSAGWLALITAVSFAPALGVASLLGSRGTSIGVLLGWWLVAMPVLFQIEGIGSARTGLIYAAAERLRPEALFEGGTAGVPMSLAAAVSVLLVWTATPLALGAWRTCTRDA